MSNLYVPPCPTTCAGSVAAVDFDDCAPVNHWGEISKLYVGSLNVPDFLDVSSITEWNTNLSDSADDKIRTLTVIGELPEPEITEVPTSGDRVAIGAKKYSMTFEVDETNDTNYNWHSMLQCPGKVKFWMETSDGLLFGGNTGCQGTIRTNYVIPKERTALQKIMGKATWNSFNAIPRCDSPLY